MTPTKIEEIQGRDNNDHFYHASPESISKALEEAIWDRHNLLKEVNRLRNVLERIVNVAERAYHAGEDRTAQLWDIAENAL